MDYIIEGATLTSIADAVRSKTGSSLSMTPAAMATAISNIETGGSVPGVELLYSNDAVSITYTSTSAGTAKSITGITGIATYPFVVVCIQNADTSSGSLKFIQSSTVISNINYAAGSVSATRYGAMQYWNSSSAKANTASTSYGLWGYTIAASGSLTIRGRCSTSYFNSLSGTYKVYVYGITF